jgi:putative sugar O-methyltransferase
MDLDETEFPTIAAMIEEVRSSPEVFRPSAFWNDWSAVNLSQLATRGFAQFKRTVNQNYFNWVFDSWRHPLLHTLLRHWVRHPDPQVFAARLEDRGWVEVGQNRVDVFSKRWQRARYALFVSLLWEWTRKHRDHRHFLDALEEPTLGHPISVLHRGRSISQDLCTSVDEVTAIMDGMDRPLVAGDRIIEVGAGYGRVGWTLLKVVPGVSYVVCDIPPALALAERYLTSLFPDLRAFRFRRFDDVDAAAAELFEADIAFVTPNQLGQLPPLEPKVFVNISSFGEMRPEQIVEYFRLVGYHASSFLYTKQWRKSVNPADGIVVRQEDYPVGASWRRVFERTHALHTEFFEAMYDTQPSS